MNVDTSMIRTLVCAYHTPTVRIVWMEMTGITFDEIDSKLHFKNMVDFNLMK